MKRLVRQYALLEKKVHITKEITERCRKARKTLKMQMMWYVNGELLGTICVWPIKFGDCVRVGLFSSDGFFRHIRVHQVFFFFGEIYMYINEYFFLGENKNFGQRAVAACVCVVTIWRALCIHNIVTVFECGCVLSARYVFFSFGREWRRKICGNPDGALNAISGVTADYSNAFQQIAPFRNSIVLYLYIFFANSFLFSILTNCLCVSPVAVSMHRR